MIYKHENDFTMDLCFLFLCCSLKCNQMISVAVSNSYWMCSWFFLQYEPNPIFWALFVQNQVAMAHELKFYGFQLHKCRHSLLLCKETRDCFPFNLHYFSFHVNEIYLVAWCVVIVNALWFLVFSIWE